MDCPVQAGTRRTVQETAKSSMEAAQLLGRVVARFIGTKHERDIKKLQPVIAAINAREAEVRALSNEELKTRFAELRTQVQEQVKDADPAEPSYKEELQKALEPAIVPAFALVREAGRCFVNMRHFDVQLIGGIVLHEGKIAEMKTGEGKTLVATLPAVLNALAGRGVHIVTVNDYLARRDAEWMSPLYRALGLSVGVIVHDLDDEHRTATLTEEGFAKCERLLSLTNMSDPANIDIMHHVYQALRAHTLYKNDVDYVVKDGEVIIVDEFTGRQMPGRRWSDGLHQAVEAKEGVK